HKTLEDGAIRRLLEAAPVRLDCFETIMDGERQPGGGKADREHRGAGRGAFAIGRSARMQQCAGWLAHGCPGDRSEKESARTRGSHPSFTGWNRHKDMQFSLLG